MELHWTVGDVVMKLRRVRGLSAGKVAKAAGMKANTVGALERGGNSQPETLAKVAAVLGTTVDEIRALVPAPTRVPQSSAVVDSDVGVARMVSETGAIAEAARDAIALAASLREELAEAQADIRRLEARTQVGIKYRKKLKRERERD